MMNKIVFFVKEELSLVSYKYGVFHLRNTSATRELSVSLDGQHLRHECHPTYLWDDTSSYAVLHRTPDKDCRQAEELKQLVDEASWFLLVC